MRLPILLLSLATALLSLSLPAEAKDKLTVYTYESFVADRGPGPKVKEAFEKTCDCEIDWVGVADGVALLNRLKIEGKNTRADVVLGLDTNLTDEAEKTGLFAPAGIDMANVKLPVAWNDKTFVPFDYGYFDIVYDTQTINDPAGSLKALVDGDPARKLVIEDPRTSTPGLGFLLWMKAVYGDDAKQAWARLKPRILTVTPGWSEAYGLFTKGEVPMVVSYTTSPAYHMIEEESDRYQALDPSDGLYLEVEVAGRIASSPHADLARKFLQFMTGPEFQDVIPTTNWMFPAGKVSGELPAAFGKLVKPAKTLMFSPEEVAANRKAWTDEWLQVMSK